MSPYGYTEYYILCDMISFILYNIKFQSSTFELIIELVLLNQDRHQAKNVRQYVRHLKIFPLKYFHGTSDKISVEKSGINRK